jgi:recombination protein RecR
MRNRDAELWVVAWRKDAEALRADGEHDGPFYVLGGILSPIQGVSPRNLALRDLIENLRQRPVRQVTIALPATLEGELTGIYLQQLIKPLRVSICHRPIRLQA